MLTPDEVRLLFDGCAGDPGTELRNRALLTVMYRAGLRCSEAISLEPKDIDLATMSIRVLHGKGDQARTVGIDPGALVEVGRWTDERSQRGFTDRQPLFCTSSGRAVLASYVRRWMTQLGRSAGIAKRVHAHGLRHTHAYELLMEGVPIPIIQRQLGHSSLSTTDIYLSHIAPKQVIDTISAREWTI